MKFNYLKMKLDFRYEPTFKVLWYFFYGSVAIFIGYCLNRPAPSNIDILWLCLVLPVLYLGNFILYHISRRSSRLIGKYIKKLHAKGQDNGTSSFFLILSVLTMSQVMELFFSKTRLLHNNNVVTVLIVSYCIIFYLHRFGRQTDRKRKKDSTDDSALTIMQYRAHRHTHVFVGAAIGFPFLIGMAISRNFVSLSQLFGDGMTVMIVYAYSCAVIYQEKYRIGRRLIFPIYIMPAIIYFGFPTLIFLTINRSVNMYYALTIVSSMLFLLPYFRNNKFLAATEKYISVERILLLIDLSILVYVVGYAGENLDSSISTVTGIDNDSFIALLLSLMGLGGCIYYGEKHNNFKLSYYIAPFFVLSLLQIFVQVGSAFKFQTIPISQFNDLSNMISTLQKIYLAIFGVWLFAFVVRRQAWRASK